MPVICGSTSLECRDSEFAVMPWATVSPSTPLHSRVCHLYGPPPHAGSPLRVCLCRKPARSRRRNVAQELQDEYDRLSTSIQEFRGVQLAGRLSGFTQLLRTRPDLMRPMSRAIKAVDDTSKRLLEVVSLGAGAAVTAEVNELNKVRCPVDFTRHVSAVASASIADPRVCLFFKLALACCACCSNRPAPAVQAALISICEIRVDAYRDPTSLMHLVQHRLQTAHAGLVAIVGDTRLDTWLQVFLVLHREALRPEAVQMCVSLQSNWTAYEDQVESRIRVWKDRAMQKCALQSPRLTPNPSHTPQPLPALPLPR